MKHRYVSAYFNAGYVYDSRYSLNASVRVEQADLFGSDPKYRYRPLWSVGGSWNVNNEGFMSDITWINLLKLRATYGITGMVDQSSSPYLLASFATSPYTNSPITIITSPPNSSLRWERTSTFNIDGMACANNGEMKNTGVEINLSYDWVKTRDISFTTSFSTAYNKNTIEKVDYLPTDALDMMRDPTSNYLRGDT